VETEASYETYRRGTGHSRCAGASTPPRQMTSRGAHPTDLEDALAKGIGQRNSAGEHPDLPMSGCPEAVGEIIYASVLNHSNAVQIRWTHRYDALLAVHVLPGPSRAARSVYCGQNGGSDEIPRYIARASMHSFSSGPALIAPIHALRQQVNSPSILGRIGLAPNGSLLTPGRDLRYAAE
jgi:hypothetical protein